MKKTLPLFIIFLLAACIPVDDIGEYWGKGVTDAALAGTWEKTSAVNPEKMTLAIASGEYTIDIVDEKLRNEKNYRSIFARTLKAGSYTFFMIDPAKPEGKSVPKSDIWRYATDKDHLTLYILRADSLDALLKKKYPGEKNICVLGSNGEKDHRYVAIKKLDEKVFKILSQIPDGPEYWKVGKEYRKLP